MKFRMRTLLIIFGYGMYFEDVGRTTFDQRIRLTSDIYFIVNSQTCFRIL